jgi:hypothetical protein
METAPVNDDSVADVSPSPKVGAPLIVEPVMVTVCVRMDTAPVNELSTAEVKPFEWTEAAEKVWACVCVTAP